jgi:hypothetical protein
MDGGTTLTILVQAQSEKFDVVFGMEDVVRASTAAKSLMNVVRASAQLRLAQSDADRDVRRDRPVMAPPGLAGISGEYRAEQAR